MKKWLLIILLLQTGVVARPQYMNIKTLDGNVVSEDLNTIEKMTLPNENLVIHLTDASIETISLFSIRRISFGPLTSIGQGLTAGIKIPSILQNPVDEVMQIRDLPENIQLAQIYSLQGNLLKQATVSSNENQINVSGLSNGLYLIRINETTLKFVKQ